MLQEQEGLSKEEYISYWKRMIREYNEAIDTGKYRPQQKSSNKEFFDMIGYDDLAFARD